VLTGVITLTLRHSILKRRYGRGERVSHNAMEKR